MSVVWRPGRPRSGADRSLPGRPRGGYLLRKDRPGRYSIVNPERGHLLLASGLTLAQAAAWINRIDRIMADLAERAR